MDFVILWVDDKDSRWRAEYEKYSLLEIGDKSACRFRDWENLRYWFRGVEKFANWVDKIFFITANQIPEWMNTNHPKLRLVNHEEYIPKEMLPTFNSNTIELFMHKLPDLSEQFVLFNDDFFIIDKISPKRFFIKGLPVDICAMNAYGGGWLSICNMCNLEIVNRNFDKRHVLRKNFSKWFSLRNGVHLIRTLLLMGWPRFTGFYDPHLPQPFLKSILKEVWDKESEAIIASIPPHFRQKANISQYLYRYWQLLTGNVKCRNVDSCSALFTIENLADVDAAEKVIKKQKKSIIVVNDAIEVDSEFEYARERINKAFESILPEKCSFEK
ncbi:MAG: hypothetical protein LBH32_05225 [Dysgonamonadaceae bacterium]|jgi:hypothetical protein|nr:hypothetical protein [Dysgonamonadaceae bacterium]